MLKRSIPQMVTRIAAEHPASVAAAESGRQLTYRELELRSNQLARFLHRQGVRADAIVGIGLERSIEFVVAALGILKAGGAYLPLDPAYPHERLEFMIRDAELGLIVTDRTHAASLPLRGAQPIEIDGADLADEPVAPLTVDIDPSSLAYVIYTSGSTGTPKGVMVEHGSLLNLVDWHRQTFGISRDDRATMVASPSFDAAVWETWPYLASGASLRLPDDETRQNPCHMRDWLLANAISISFAPTPMAEALLALDWPQTAPLRFLLTGADALQRYPRPGLPFRLVNNYGPTECTVVTTSAVIPPVGQQAGPPTIGAPIANVEVRILDRELLPASEGELFIAGAGLARGYLRRPEQTAEKFVLGMDGTRLYRTGDVVRQMPDGSIDFIGRLDDQVKIRGYRIELGEVGWALEQHPAVEACIVVARADATGRPALVAYVVPNDSGVTVPELRDFLEARLPEYMVPSAFVRIEALPLMASGKVDRGQLPEPRPEIMLSTSEDEAGGGIVRQVGALVAELLGLEEVSNRDNFFLMGGHSLFAAQLSARIRDAFGVELPLRTVFDAPTVAGLAGAVDRLLVAAVESLTEAEAQRLVA